MATFELTLRHNMCIDRQTWDKGQQFDIKIGMMGITPTNLFGNSRCVDTVLRQFSAQGLDLPRNSPFLNRGHWDIKMKP